MFVAGWRHALRSEWPFIIIIIIRKRHALRSEWPFIIIINRKRDLAIQSGPRPEELVWCSQIMHGTAYQF